MALARIYQKARTNGRSIDAHMSEMIAESAHLLVLIGTVGVRTIMLLLLERRRYSVTERFRATLRLP